MRIRPIRRTDAERFLTLVRLLDQQTSFMMLEPGERTTTATEQAERIESLLASDRNLVLVAENADGTLVGYLAAHGGEFRRSQHMAWIVVGILAGHTGKGIGTQLFATLEEWARSRQFHRLELTVMTHNERGIALYRKMGFEIEGTKRHALRVNGEWVDEHMMAKLI